MVWDALKNFVMKLDLGTRNLHSKYTLSMEKFKHTWICWCRIYRQFNGLIGYLHVCEACAEFLSLCSRKWGREESRRKQSFKERKPKAKKKWGINNQASSLFSMILSLKMTSCLDCSAARFLWHVMYLSRFLSITSLVDEKEWSFFLCSPCLYHCKVGKNDFKVDN